MLAALLLAAAAPDPVVLALVKDDKGRHCLSDRSLCLDIPKSEDGDAEGNLLIFAPGDAAEPTVQPLPTLADGGTPEIWPGLIVVRAWPDEAAETRRFVAGILARQSSMYSGGGGSAARLHLYEFVASPAAKGLGAEVLDVVWDGSLLIKACSSEQDMKDRMEACHDEYDFGAKLSAAPTDGAALPSLVYRTVATAYPRTSRRMDDNMTKPPLKRADLVRWTDPECSYERVLRYNPATSRYEMDRPAPDCSDYTIP